MELIRLTVHPSWGHFTTQELSRPPLQFTPYKNLEFRKIYKAFVAANFHEHRLTGATRLYHTFEKARDAGVNYTNYLILGKFPSCLLKELPTYLTGAELFEWIQRRLTEAGVQTVGVNLHVFTFCNDMTIDDTKIPMPTGV
jgi:hypothetical protein